MTAGTVMLALNPEDAEALEFALARAARDQRRYALSNADRAKQETELGRFEIATALREIQSECIVRSEKIDGLRRQLEAATVGAGV